MMKIEGSEVSHIGLGFLDDKKIVLDATKPYSKIYHLDHWKTKYEIVHTINIPLPKDIEDIAYKVAVDYCMLKPYDWGAYYYAWVCGLRRYFFKIKVPTVNKYALEHGLWCTEVIRPLKHILKNEGLDYTDINLSATTPQMVFDIAKNQGWEWE